MDTNELRPITQKEFPKKAHEVTSVYILNPERSHVLFLKHNKLGLWLPPGGHLDQEELPQAGARREVAEETGIKDFIFLDIVDRDLQLVSMDQRQVDTNTWIDSRREIQRPLAVVEEIIPQSSKEPEHTHVDFVYAATVSDVRDIVMDQRESSGKAWIPLEDESIESLETFPNIKAVLRILKQSTAKTE